MSDPQLPGRPEPSIGDIVSRSWTTMVAILFQPFAVRVWLVLGLAAFLQQCGSTGGGGAGGNFNFNFGGGPGPGGGPSDMEEAVAWLQQFLQNYGGMILGIAIGGGILLFLFGLAAKWLSAVGDLLLVDNLSRHDAQISEPFKRLLPLMNSLFGLKAAFYAVNFVVFLALGIPVLVMGLRVIDAGEGFSSLILPASIAGGLGVLYMIPVLLFNAFINNLVLPTMHARSMRSIPALGASWQLVRGNFGTVLLYLLVRLGLMIAATVVGAMIGCLLGCALICVIWIPGLGAFVMTVLLLPIPVFFQAMAMHLVDALDPGHPTFQPIDPYFGGLGGYAPSAVPDPPGFGDANPYAAPASDPNWQPPPDPFHSPPPLPPGDEPPPPPPPPPEYR